LAISGKTFPPPTLPVSGGSRVDGVDRYARAYLDFFEDEVVRSNYDWKRVVQRYVVEGDEPLLSGMISGGSPHTHPHDFISKDTDDKLVIH